MDRTEFLNQIPLHDIPVVNYANINRPRLRGNTHTGKMIYSGLKGLSALGGSYMGYKNAPSTHTMKHRAFRGVMRNVVQPFEKRTGFINNYVIPYYKTKGTPKYTNYTNSYKSYPRYSNYNSNTNSSYRQYPKRTYKKKRYYKKRY